MTKLQAAHAEKRAEVQRYWRDDPFDSNLIDVLLEGQGSACADFFQRIDENKFSSAASAASASSLVALEEQSDDFYRKLPDAETYILSKKEQQE